MRRSGPPPKPTALKKLAGNPGKRPLPENEPHPPVPTHTPRAPRHLNDEGKREWRRIVKVLVRLGLYTVVDRAALAMYCQAWGRWVEAENKLNEVDLVIASDKGNLYQNPWLGVASKAWSQLSKILPEFGLTPSARARLEVIPQEDEPTLAEMLFGADVQVADGR